MAYTNAQLRQILRQAGWPEALIPIMAAIGIAESSGNPTASRYRVAGQGQRLPEQSIGLWQVNRLAHPQYGTEWLKDPVNNAKAALQIYADRVKKGLNGLTAWGSFTDGRYRRYLQGDESISGGGSPVAAQASTTSSSWLGFGLFDTIPDGLEKYQQYAKPNKLLSNQSRYLVAVAIVVLVFAFAYREF